MNTPKYLIIPTQSFSIGIKGKKHIDQNDLPWIVRMFLRVFNNKVHIILDEASWIKTNQAMPEHKKSSRSRSIKLLEELSESRCALTGTLMSKSPINVVDPYSFLSSAVFAGDNVYDFAEHYCVMMSLRAVRGRRVMISQKEWLRVRKRLITAYKIGGETQLSYAKDRVGADIGVSRDDCEHILLNKEYNPFKNVKGLMNRLESLTVTVERQDIFDITPDRFIYNPIKRPVEIGAVAKKLGTELIKVGFTDNMELGRAPALELLIRLQDLCNGFEPVKTAGEDEKPVITYVRLKENPKLEELGNLLEEIDTLKNQVVVYCSRRNAFESIEEMLTKADISFSSYSGEQSDEEKQASQDAVISGEARVFLANPSSASFGLNCLRDVNYVIWYCVDASVERYHQAQHRVLRGQSKALKFAYHIYIKGSVEERIYAAMDAGLELLGAANSRSVFDFV